MASVVRQANFTLPEDLLDELKRTVPKGEQSKVVGASVAQRVEADQVQEGVRKKLRRMESGQAS